MSLKNVNTVLAAAGALFVLYLGMSDILAPEATAPGFGLPHWPAGDASGFIVVKGSREFAMGLVLGVLLLTGHRRALGLVLLMEAVAPFGDMIIVLSRHGSAAAAFGIHGLTSALIVATGLLLLRETSRARKPQDAAVPAPA